MTLPIPETPPASSERPVARVTRQRAPFTRGDLVSLLLGVALAAAMLGWFSWRMAQNVARDRDVESQAEAPPHAH